MAHSPFDLFRAARDELLVARTDYEAARARFHWPELSSFNWALDWFDVIAAGNDVAALRVVGEGLVDLTVSYQALAHRSSQVAAGLQALGVSAGDRLVVMLGNQVELWETVLGAMKIGAVVIPTSTLVGAAELADRITRGDARCMVCDAALSPSVTGVAGDCLRIAVGAPVERWLSYAEVTDMGTSFRRAETRAGDTAFLYFTSGTTATPKIVEHSHASYPVGHLSTMYWIGLQPGDVHLNVSSPGWAKHAWSSIFAPWNAEATVVVYGAARFEPSAFLEQLSRCQVTTLCAPPTVWRMLIQVDLAARPVAVREAVAAGEPLNPEVIVRIREAWGVTVRDGYGQTETTAMIGNPPDMQVKPGSMGRVLPGFEIVLRDPLTGAERADGEIVVAGGSRPIGLMMGYAGGSGDAATTSDAAGYHRTGDLATRDGDDYFTYVGRVDDVFKASDYRISPFELESVLIEHAAVAEAAIVPSPHPVRLSVPKAYVTLVSGFEPDLQTATAILGHCRARLAPYKRIRRIQFVMELPKTVSGKIRRVDLRRRESERDATGVARAPHEYWEEDLVPPASR